MAGPPEEAPRPHRRMYTEKKPMKKKAATSATRSTTMGALKPCGWFGMPYPPPLLSLSRDGGCAAAGPASSISSRVSAASGAWWRGVVMWRGWVGGVRLLDGVAGVRGA